MLRLPRDARARTQGERGRAARAAATLRPWRVPLLLLLLMRRHHYWSLPQPQPPLLLLAPLPSSPLARVETAPGGACTKLKFIQYGKLSG